MSARSTGRSRLATVLVLAAALAAGCADRTPIPASVVGLTVQGCDPGSQSGSGTFVRIDGFDEPLVLTAAHTLRNAQEIVVHRGDGPQRGVGTIVAFDPDMDLALVAVDGVASFTPLPVGSGAITGGEDAVVYVVRRGQRIALPTTIRRRVNIRTEDIYVDGETVRPGYEIAVDIDAGDSGGAVVVDGQVVGVVWARSRRDDFRAYAIDPDRAGERIREQLRTGDLGDVDLDRCR